jgi:O-antigen/teichoic acid export membrane protein
MSLVNIAVLLISYPIYIKSLGMEVYGLWVLISVLINISSSVETGLFDGLVRSFSKSYSDGKFEKMGNEIYSYLVFSVFLSIVISAFVAISSNLFILALSVPDQYTVAVIDMFPYISVLIAISLVQGGIKAVLTGMGLYQYTNYWYTFARIAQLLLGVLLLYKGYEIWSLLFSTILFHLLLLFLYSYKLLLLKEFNLNHSSFKLSFLYGTLNFSSKIAFSRIFQKISIDEMFKVIFSKYFGLELLAAYEVAFRSIGLIRNVANNMMKPVINMVNDLANQGGYQGIKNFIHDIHKKYTRIWMLFFIMSFFIFEYAINLWLPFQDNSDITSYFKILLVGYVFNLYAIPYYYVIAGWGDANSIIKSVLIACLSLYLIIFIGSLLGTDNDLWLIKSYALMLVINAFYFKYIYNKKINQG